MTFATLYGQNEMMAGDRKIKCKLFFLFLISALAFLLSLHAGSAALSWSQIFTAIFSRQIDSVSSFVMLHLRLPRTEAAFIIGGCLGTTGLVLQTLLRNPLAEPYTLGLSGGSAAGAVVALYFSLTPAAFWIPTFSTVGCLVAVGLVLGLGRRHMEYQSRSLILFGVMVSLFFGALVVSGLSILSPEKLQTALFWLLGEFGTSRDEWIKLLGLPLAGCLALFWARASALDALSLGEARARALGFSARHELRLLILLCTLVTAFCVSMVGLVGFIGLVSPHLARRFLKVSRHRFLLVGSFFVGAFLLTFADSLARLLAGQGEVPAGSIAALIGAPVLIMLLTGKSRGGFDVARE